MEQVKLQMEQVKLQVEKFLTKTQKLLGVPVEADINRVKDTLEALRKVRPDLIDAKIFERLSRFVDSVKIAKDTQVQVKGLSSDVDKLKAETVRLIQNMQIMKESFDGLERRLMFNAESERQTKKKLGVVLEGLEQYLRRYG